MSAALDRTKLARVLGMLGSDHAGERAAAALQAERLRLEAGLSWPEIVAPTTIATRQSVAPAHPASIEERIEICAVNADLLTGWERRFVASIARRPASRLSRKQLDILDRLTRSIIARRGAP